MYQYISGFNSAWRYGNLYHWLDTWEDLYWLEPGAGIRLRSKTNSSVRLVGVSCDWCPGFPRPCSRRPRLFVPEMQCGDSETRTHLDTRTTKYTSQLSHSFSYVHFYIEASRWAYSVSTNMTTKHFGVFLRLSSGKIASVMVDIIRS